MAEHNHAEHVQSLELAFARAVSEELSQDPLACDLCMAIGAALSKIVEIRFLLTNAHIDDRVELEQALATAIVDRRAIGGHRPKAALS